MIGKYKLNEIYNEDSYLAIKDIPDKSVDLVIIDPPYYIESTKSGMKSDLAKSIQNMNNQLEDNNLTIGLNLDILEDLYRIMKKPNIYIWCNHKQIIDYLIFFVVNKGCKFDMLFWRKTNATPLFCNKYLTDKEYCLYFRDGGYCNPQNYEDAKTIFDEPINILDKRQYDHPTIKPYKIVETLIKNSSLENDIVADFFLGSGTTCVAAKELGRRYIGFEIDEKYYNIAKDRLSGINQREREKIENGQISLF